jgi:hypothetical protein
MARLTKRQHPPLRDGARARGRQPGRFGPSTVGEAVPGEDSLHGDGEHPVEDLEIEDDDNIRDDTADLFSIDLGDGSNPIDVHAGDGDGVAASTDTNVASSGAMGRHGT